MYKREEYQVNNTRLPSLRQPCLFCAFNIVSKSHYKAVVLFLVIREFFQ